MAKVKECSRQGEIISEFGRLNDRKEELHNRIGFLFDRLQEVMRKPKPKPPTSAPPEEVIKETLSSQFAIDLSSIKSLIESDLDKINDIIDRLDF